MAIAYLVAGAYIVIFITFKLFIFMKKAFYIIGIALLFYACKGPQGEKGDIGPQGATGATGAQGPAGTASKARYYDFVISFPENSPGSISNYEMKDYDFSKEMPLVYVTSSSLVKQLPLKNDAMVAVGGSINIVDMTYTSAAGKAGIFFFNEWNYSKNPVASYSIRLVLIPIQLGGKLNANSRIPYDELVKQYQLVEMK